MVNEYHERPRLQDHRDRRHLDHAGGVEPGHPGRLQAVGRAWLADLVIDRIDGCGLACPVIGGWTDMQVRLWDPRALDAVCEEFQEIRLYYEFTSGGLPDLLIKDLPPKSTRRSSSCRGRWRRC